MGNSLKRWGVGLCSALLGACSAMNSDIPRDRAQLQANIELPIDWMQDSQKQGQQGEQILTVQDNWLAGFNDQTMQALVDKSINNNHQLKLQAYSVQIKQQQLISAGSALWPSLNTSLNTSRRKSSGDSASYSNSSGVSLDLGYEVDIWGKLSDNQRQANLSYLAQQARFEQAKQQLVADVVTSWYAVIEAQQLLALFQRRSDNSQQNLDIIDAGYRRGLNSALDVYLTRNELNNEKARVAQQQDSKSQLIRRLERLVGDYPAAELMINAELPWLDSTIPLGLPAHLISRKPDLQANWYQLLADDAGLAYAHKQRFPSINLTAAVSDSGTDLDDLLSGSALGWSLLGGLTAPIFTAGKLKANEAQARLAVEQEEQTYLDTLYDAFASVENAVSAERSLQTRYQAMIKAQDNAVAAQSLSFEQYQKGLVDYTTVLDAQSRSYDAQSTVIQLKNQLITNRVKLHLALGGDFK